MDQYNYKGYSYYCLEHQTVRQIKNVQIVDPQEKEDWIQITSFNRKDYGGQIDVQATFNHLKQHPIIQVKLNEQIIVQRRLEPRPKRNSFHVSKGIPNYNVEITEDYITWHSDNSKQVNKLYSYNATTKVAVDINGQVYLPVSTSTNTVDESLLQHLDLRTIDELGLAARYRAHEEYIIKEKVQKQIMVIQNNKMIIRRGAVKMTFPCQVLQNNSYQFFLDRFIGAQKFDYIPVLLKEDDDAPLITGITRDTDQIGNYVLHKRREHIRLNNSLEIVVNATTNLLQAWKLMEDQGYLTYRNFSQFYLAFRIGEQYSTIKGNWNMKLLKILDQENQVLLDNVKSGCNLIVHHGRGDISLHTIRRDYKAIVFSAQTTVICKI